MTVRQRALDDQGGLIGAHRLVPEHPPQGLDARRGPVGTTARVRFLTLLPSRQPSRSKTAGRELRLGTISTYMGTIIHIL